MNYYYYYYSILNAFQDFFPSIFFMLDSIDRRLIREICHTAIVPSLLPLPDTIYFPTKHNERTVSLWARNDFSHSKFLMLNILNLPFLEPAQIFTSNRLVDNRQECFFLKILPNHSQIERLDILCNHQHSIAFSERNSSTPRRIRIRFLCFQPKSKSFFICRF